MHLILYNNTEHGTADISHLREAFLVKLAFNIMSISQVTAMPQTQ